MRHDEAMLTIDQAVVRALEALQGESPDGAQQAWDTAWTVLRESREKGGGFYAARWVARLYQAGEQSDHSLRDPAEELALFDGIWGEDGFQS